MAWVEPTDTLEDQVKPFCPELTRTDEGWVVFPDDVAIRKQYFPPQVMQHPAKANIHMIQAIVDMVSKEGETILDPMSGTGTIMVAALTGRRVVLVEVENGYHEMQKAGLMVFEILRPDVRGKILLINADCRKVLPLPCDHIIFSPPYAGILKFQAKKESTRSLSGSYKDSIQDYSASPGNVGTTNRFFYNQAMEVVYGKCFESLRPGGTMTIILQDSFEQDGDGNRRRVFLSKWMERVCHRAGFATLAWNKRLASGTGFKRLWQSRGMEMVMDEDIVTYIKPT